jgi:hypothetical protein
LQLDFSCFPAQFGAGAVVNPACIPDHLLFTPFELPDLVLRGVRHLTPEQTSCYIRMVLRASFILLEQ